MLEWKFHEEERLRVIVECRLWKEKGMCGEEEWIDTYAVLGRCRGRKVG